MQSKKPDTLAIWYFKWFCSPEVFFGWITEHKKSILKLFLRIFWACRDEYRDGKKPHIKKDETINFARECRLAARKRAKNFYICIKVYIYDAQLVILPLLQSSLFRRSSPFWFLSHSIYISFILISMRQFLICIRLKLQADFFSGRNEYFPTYCRVSTSRSLLNDVLFLDGRRRKRRQRNFIPSWACHEIFSIGYCSSLKTKTFFIVKKRETLHRIPLLLQHNWIYEAWYFYHRVIIYNFSIIKMVFHHQHIHFFCRPRLVFLHANGKRMIF